MKEMMKKVKERREGFTMAELLIVVAIIAVLVAVAIPVFSSQLGKAQASTDAANVRSAYAELIATNLSDPKATLTNGTVTAKGSSSDLPTDITWPANLTKCDWTKGQTITLTPTVDPNTGLISKITMTASGA